MSGNWHDACLYYGIMAEADPSYLDYIIHCQASDGRVCRNPEDAYLHEPYVNASSRDMMIGFHLAIASCPDYYAFTKYELLFNHVDYLRTHNWKLCPEATDNRNRVGGIGMAQVESLLSQAGSTIVQRIRAMGLKAFIISRIFKPLMKPTMVLEALTAWDGFQINLIMAALLMYRHLDGKDSIWAKWAIKIMKMRYSSNHPCGMLSYIEGDLKALKKVESNVSENGDIWPPSQFSQWLVQDRSMPLYKIYLKTCIDKLESGM